MVLISKVSKGSKMDQIYIPKNRPEFPIGSYIVIKKLETEKKQPETFFYNIKYLEPIKVEIIKEIFKDIEAENIIITGSFLNEGFKFNDVDIIIITEEKPNLNSMSDMIKKKIGINTHLITITNKALITGIETDPLYGAMLRKYVSKKRIIYKPKQKTKYKLLDLHLLKSETLITNFDILTGEEKYRMTRNLVAINLFIDKKSKYDLDSEINKLFGKETTKKLKNNMLSKKEFIKKYKNIYNQTKNKILKGIQNESK